MTEATRQILTTPDLHARMSAAARQRAVSEFELDRIVPQYEAHYRAVMERRSVAA